MKKMWMAAALCAAMAVDAAGAVKRLDGRVVPPAEIDETVTRLMKAPDVTGLGLAMFDGGRVAYVRAYGLRDKERGLPLTVESVMSAASLSKAAFAVMVLQLVDEGKLELDKPVVRYLPKPLAEYSNYGDLKGDARVERITARMLLSHTAGFPNWRWFQDDRKLNINFEPGSRYAYSGEGLLLLQLVVETITGKPLEELMRERVFAPFGMRRTSMVWQSRFESDFANGYDERGRMLGPSKPKDANAAGSLQTTVADYARFLEAVLRGDGLKKATRAQMLNPQIRIVSKHQFPTLAAEMTHDNDGIKLSYGLGWGLYWTPYGKAFFKEGHDGGWRHYAVCFDGLGRGLLMMSNSGNAEGMFGELLETVLGNRFTPLEWEGYTAWDKLPPRTALPKRAEARVDAAVLERYVGRYGEPPNLILTVRREGDHLTVQENGEPKQELGAMGGGRFFSRASDDELTFEADGSGRVVGMVLHVGRDVRLKRIE